MATYTVDSYATSALVDAAIVLIETTDPFKLISYQDGNNPKFMIVKPAPNKTA